MGLQSLLDADEILQRLRHLSTGYVQVTGVPEMIYPAVSLIVCFTLCDFIVVVGEFEIDTSSMDIDRWVRKYSTRHC